MEYLIGGYSNSPKLIIDQAIDFFENYLSNSFYFDGIINDKYFMGIIKEKRNKEKENACFFDDNKIFKSLYYSKVPEVLRRNQPSMTSFDIINSLINDFIYAEYDDSKGIKVYIDKFTREKIFYTKSSPLLFSTSYKFLISITENKKINYDVLTRFLITGVIVGINSIFSNIKRLDVGEYLHINKNKLKVEKNWNINKKYFEISDYNSKDLSYWTNYLYDSLKETLIYPDKKPILSLMSGGLDSTVITSILSKEYDIPIEALTISVPNYNEEEVEKAKEIAEFLEIPHVIKETKIKDIEIFENFYSEIFKILEEPMGGTAFLSRYFAFEEINKMDKNRVLTGDGAGEVLSFLREIVIQNFKYTDYIYHIPLRIRKGSMKLLHKLYSPISKMAGLVFDKNNINSLAILSNTDFLQANSRFETFFASYQFTNLDEINNITNRDVNYQTYLKPIIKNFHDYPFNDFNKYGYNSMISCLNSDAYICTNLSHYFDLKCYRPYLSDVAFKKVLTLHPYLKLIGDRSKWLVREMAKRMKLLPQNYFDWKPKYGLRQTFMEDDAFNFVKSYILRLIDSMENQSFINLSKFTKFFKKITLKRITYHSLEYMKFNIWFVMLGWLASI